MVRPLRLCGRRGRDSLLSLKISLAPLSRPAERSASSILLIPFVHNRLAFAYSLGYLLSDILWNILTLSLLILIDLHFDCLLASPPTSISVLLPSTATEAAATRLRLADDLDRLG